MNDKTDTFRKNQPTTGIPTKTVSFTAILGVLTAYSHYFGTSYWKSYLAGAGFNSVDVELTPEMSLFHAASGMSEGIGNLFTINLLTLWKSNISVGLGLAISVIGVYLIRKLTSIDSNPRKDSFGDWLRGNLREKSKTLKGTITTSIIAFVGGYLFNILFLAGFVMIIGTLWMFLVLGILVGYTNGANLIEEPICPEISFNSTSRKAAFSCSEIYLNNSNKLTGKITHRQSGKLFFLTECGSYEISSERTILTFNPLKTKDKRNNSIGCETPIIPDISINS